MEIGTVVQLVIMEVRQQTQLQLVMEHVQQVITALLVQQVQHKLYAELGNTALLEVQVQLIALQAITAVLPQIPAQHAMEHAQQVIIVQQEAQVLRRMHAEQEIIVQQQAEVLQFALQGHMEVLQL